MTATKCIVGAILLSVALATPHTIVHNGVTFDRWGEGCGSSHFPPNGTGDHDYSNITRVNSTCENYGLHNGPDGKDLEVSYSAKLPKVIEYDARYGDCGGGYQVYLRQSMPGYGTHATGDDGHAMKNWWPFMYY